MNKMKKRVEAAITDLQEIYQEMGDLDEERQQALIELGRQKLREAARREGVDPDRADSAVSLNEIIMKLVEGNQKIKQAKLDVIKLLGGDD